MPALRSAIILLFVSQSIIFAQETGDLTFAGTVANSNTGEPIARALVEINTVGAARARTNGVPVGGRPPAVHALSTFTDPSGAFQFSGLTAGRYSITVSKPEFLDFTMTGTRQPFLELTASISGHRIELVPLGVITGKIVDQDEMPAAGVNVVCLTTQVENGLAHIQSDRSVVTDDRGIYRFWNLTPGRYYVKANGHSGGTSVYEGADPPQIADESIEPVYFGGGSLVDAAMPVVVTAGATVQADFHVAYVPSFRTRGVLRDAAAGRPIKFELLTGPDDVLPARVTLNNATGRFEVGATPPGDYILRASQDDNTAETPIRLSGADLDGVEMKLAPPVSIPVSVQIPQSSGRTTADSDDANLRRFESEPTCTAALYPTGRLSAQPGYDQRVFIGKRGPNSNDTSIGGLIPGKYRVQIQCNGAWPQSALWGSQDIARDNIITIQPFSTPPGIQIFAVAGGGELKGKVAGVAGTDSTAILVPQFSTPAGVLIAPMFQQGPNQQEETQFRRMNLAPGDYMVWVLSGAARTGLEYNNPEVMKKLSGGVRVHVTEDVPQEITIEKVVRDLDGALK